MEVTLDLSQPVPIAIEEDQETMDAIQRGVEAADQGRTVPIEEVRKMIPAWISELKSRNRR